MISPEDIAHLPEQPGVYLMSNAEGRILYIGKAVNIRSRVQSHFASSNTFKSFYPQVATVDFLVTDNEVDALLLENSLVKEKQPPYNVRLKDDKRFPYLKLSLDEKFPQLYLTRTLPKKSEVTKKRDKTNPRYFGPYVHVHEARKTLQTLQEIFPLRSCRIPSKDLKLDRPCLEFEMHQCLAPCVASECGEEEYRELALKVEKFLEGDHKEVREDLESKMAAAAENLAFEKAAIYRDAIEALGSLKQRQAIDLLQEDSEDYLAASQLGDITCVAVIRRRGGAIRGSQHYFLEVETETSVKEVLSAFIEQHYSVAPEIPRRILCTELPYSHEVLSKWLTSQTSKRIDVKQPHRGPRLKMLDMAQQNAEFHAAEQYRKTHGNKRRLHPAVLRLGVDLKLNPMPVRIEGFDISHHRGEEPVASMVVFENGVAKESDYRKFKIKSARGGDDFRSMEEVIGRRFLHTEESFGRLPDLVLIDGGPVQLEFALLAKNRIAENLEEPYRSQVENIPMVSLAKREEEIFLPEQSEPVVFDDRHEGRRLLQQVRDESHRFAIGFHRKRKGGKRQTSQLESIPGVGPARMEKLLIRFRSMEGVAQ
ncbi:MAG: excinuclease ABC subunit UvrC, partial [Candidatus Omnitrophica bacterium]|nr:excinuclease ABC subunit UvrC [Candidatus Omnitrophota bacterium]